MSLEFWVVLWKLVLIGGTGLFCLLAIVVTIGGARDIRRLFQTLREDHARRQSSSQSSSQSKTDIRDRDR